MCLVPRFSFGFYTTNRFNASKAKQIIIITIIIIVIFVNKNIKNVLFFFLSLKRKYYLFCIIFAFCVASCQRLLTSLDRKR